MFTVVTSELPLNQRLLHWRCQQCNEKRVRVYVCVFLYLLHVEHQYTILYYQSEDILGCGVILVGLKTLKDSGFWPDFKIRVGQGFSDGLGYSKDQGDALCLWKPSQR